MLSGDSTSVRTRGIILSGESTSEQPSDRVLSRYSRNIINQSEDDDAESISSRIDSQSRPWENVSEFTSNSDRSEFAIHSLLDERKQRRLVREVHQDPDRDRYTSDEEGTVVDNAAGELQLIAVSKRSTRLLRHGKVPCTSLEPSVQEATSLKKIWCVKLMGDAHAPEIVMEQLNVSKTALKARYRLSESFKG